MFIAAQGQIRQAHTPVPHEDKPQGKAYGGVVTYTLAPDELEAKRAEWDRLIEMERRGKEQFGHETE